MLKKKRRWFPPTPKFIEPFFIINGLVDIGCLTRGNGIDVCTFRDKVSNQAIAVFVTGSVARMIRTPKINFCTLLISSAFLFYVLVSREFITVIKRDGFEDFREILSIVFL